ncbi:MAG TPA: DUF29 domain-containing protein [Lichenihabitans sp.]|jgi:hypothetical protein|nr:DUF29 domain-containing protein [Lichenihabitans sp.]
MDRHAWALEQATMLERGRHEGLDTLLLAEEMTELGRSEYSALLSALTRLLQHLLKWDHQPRRRGRSWVNTIDEQWERVRDRLDDSPSLRGQLDVILAKAYSKGRAAMLRETLLTSDMIPEICPYAWDDIMTREIVWPED